MLFNIFFRKSPLGKELIYVNFQSTSLVFYHIIHPGLCKTGLIGFIVAVFSNINHYIWWNVSPVTDDVNDDIGLELLPPVGCELVNVSYGFSIIAVNVEDGTVISLPNICCIRCRTRETRIGCKSNLIVHNNVDSPSSAITPVVEKDLRAIVG